MKINEEKVLSSIDGGYREEALKMIGYLKKRYIPYKELKESKVLRASLVWILKHEGYTYLSNKIYKLFNKREINYKEIYEVLINANILKRDNINIVTDLDFKKGIQFKEEKGINKTYFIKLLQDKYPFKIKYISNEYNGFVDVKFKNKEFLNEIEIKIEIPSNINYPIEIREMLIIYTDYKIKIIEFDITKISETQDSKYYNLRYLNMILSVKERTRRILATNKGKIFLEKASNSNLVRDYIRDIGNKEIAFELFRQYQIYVEIKKGEMSIRLYKEIVENFIEVEDINIKVVYLIEEFISKTSLISEKMKRYLEKAYEEGYLSELTDEVLEILKFTNFSIKIKKKLNLLDDETLADFKEGNVSLEMASKILGTKGLRYDRELLKIIYDFYRETDDVKALETVINKRRQINFKINDGDIVSLINKRKEGINVDDRSIILGGEEFKASNRYIREEIERIKIQRIFKRSKN